MPYITNKAFHEADGVGDWRVLFWGAHVFYRTPTYAEGASLVAAIAAIAQELDHLPDVDLRPEGVTVRTSTNRNGLLSDVDTVLARRISEAAHALGLTADASMLKVVGLAIAQEPGQDVRPFWTAALGYDTLDGEDALDPVRRGPHLWFHDIDPPKPGRGRLHIDISVPADHVRARVDAAMAAGGRMVDDSNAPETYTLASPENHGVDIAGWADHSDWAPDDEANYN